jgi:hypothetical protein
MKELVKRILKFPFKKLGNFGHKLQRLEFNAKNYIEFKLFKSDRTFYDNEYKKYQTKQNTKHSLNEYGERIYHDTSTIKRS